MNFAYDGYYAWMIVATSFVLLMTAPGLALFYGGMSRSKSVLNMLMMSFSALAVVGVVYALWGWSMSYGPNDIALLLSNPFDEFGLNGTDPFSYIFVGFQMTFAVITVALISGAIADRMKFSAWMVFVPIWVTLNYFPLSHQVFGGGFLSGAKNGLADLIFSGDGAAETAPIDYAGGTLVHINAGTAGLVLALILGARLGFGKEPMRPHNLTLTMLGAGLLWFGWFGFNVGSIILPNGSTEGGADAAAADLAAFSTETGLVWLATTFATCAAILGWLLVEKIRDGHATSLGAASGVVAGLVAITPACGAVTPVGAIVLGFASGVGCALAVGLKYKFKYDDSLDVVGVHLVGGLIGTIGVGLLAADVNGLEATGLLYGGGVQQLVVQIAIALYAMVWSGVITAVIALGIKAVMGLRIGEDDELEGIDNLEHAESAYDFSSSTGRGGRSLTGSHAATPGSRVAKEGADA